jgi:hypothetical protein
MLYNGPPDQPSNPNAPYIDGVPAAGIEGSIVPAGAVEFDQREIVEVVNRAYLRGYFDFSGATCGAPSNADLQQLRKAIEGFITNVEYFIDHPVTYTVHGPGAKFADLNEAMNWLAKYKILRNGFVTLQIAGATSGVAQQFVYNTSVVLEHPNSSKIAITGAPLIAAAPNEGSFVVTGVGYNLADANNHVAMLRATLGTELHFINGHSMVVLNDFSISNLLITGDGSVVNDNDWGPLLLFNAGLPVISNIAVHGTGGNAGLMVNQAYLVMHGQWISVSGCTGVWGYEFQGDVLANTVNGTIAASNNGSGFTCQCGTSIKNGYITAKGNARNGFESYYSTHAIVLRSYNNGQYGLWAAGSAMTAGGAGYYANNGTGVAVYATLGSAVNIPGVNVASGALSPPLNTVGNSNSMISG